VTASEIAFLAMGFLLGVAGGAVLVAYTRSHPPVSPEVRVTMAPDAIPRRRSSTLADDAFTPPVAAAVTARGGPADRSSDYDDFHPSGPEPRTPVRSEPGAASATAAIGEGPAVPQPGALREPVFRLAAPPASARVAASAQAAQAVPVSGGADPMMTALRAAAARDAEVALAALRRSAAVPAPIGGGSGSRVDAPGLEALIEPPSTGSDPGPIGRSSNAGSAATGSAAAATGGSPAPVDETDVAEPAVAAGGPCIEARRLADERCELATRAREGAVSAEETLRASQRALEEHEAAAEAAAAAADSRAVRQAKDEAQARFRSGRARAGTIDDVEAAARAWLLEINTINSSAREALAALSRERELANDIAHRLERLSMDAEAARISAETAEAACLAARQELADCEEREAEGPRGHRPVLPPSDPQDDLPVAAGAGAALGSSGSPRIFRLLRGDRQAMAEMVGALAEDGTDRRKWQLAIAELIDAILADSIAGASLDFPEEHAFWGPFTLEQNREITRALSSLGYRFDGLGGWVDERVPSQRDLSLALGYAGLDPMRMRHWPTESEMVDLYRDVEVAAAEHLSGAAGDLTLGELVSMLGRRADGLAEVWNQWGRIRPLLLEET
jgi:hypothetical protein